MTKGFLCCSHGFSCVWLRSCGAVGITSCAVGVCEPRRCCACANAEALYKTISEAYAKTLRKANQSSNCSSDGASNRETDFSSDFPPNESSYRHASAA